jgi:hypothetical protein
MVYARQQDYYNALAQSTKAGESTPFIEFMLQVILEQTQACATDTPQDTPQPTPQVVSLLEMLVVPAMPLHRKLAQGTLSVHSSLRAHYKGLLRSSIAARHERRWSASENQ